MFRSTEEIRELLVAINIKIKTENDPLNLLYLHGVTSRLEALIREAAIRDVDEWLEGMDVFTET